MGDVQVFCVDSPFYSSSITLVTSNNNRVLLDSQELNAASGVSLTMSFQCVLSTRCVIMMHECIKIFFCACWKPIICSLTNIIPNYSLKAFNLCCGEAYARFSELKRLKVHPGNMTKERDAVSS